jgi:hypothetical protein
MMHTANVDVDSPSRKLQLDRQANKETDKSDDTDANAIVESKVITDASQLTLFMLFDPSLPWVLVENGSIGGYFDWVPLEWRVGGWSVCAVVYLTAVWYITILCGIYLYNEKESFISWWDIDVGIQNAGIEIATSSSYLASDKPSWRYLASWIPSDSCIDEKYLNVHSDSRYLGPYSIQWIYNTLTCLWMLIVMYSIMRQSPAGFRAWGTYTVQSWTLLTIRHGLCSVAPFSKVFSILAEATRFPVACSSTVTFLVWNVVLAPFIYLFGMKDPEKRRGFLKFMFSFRLVQIHVFNMLFCYLNIAWASPPRELHAVDFYLALVSVIVYMTFYLMVLDRIGVHLYPIFHPRSHIMSVISWSAILGLYVMVFRGWRMHLLKTG